MFDPISTYRVQFHKGFNFSDLEDIIPYLQKLGIKTLYASPVFKAVPGSMHGYDVTDTHSINPEIGTLEQLYDVSKKLHQAGISWLQDIVPNHMALHEENNWLMDVLERGKKSPYADYFDIDWEHPACAGKLMLPVLGTTPEDAIDKGDITVVRKNGKLLLQCGMLLPLSTESLALAAGEMAGTPDMESSLRADNANENKKPLAGLLDKQHYLLCKHDVASRQINYRRFFTVNSLISLNMQRKEVFDDYHTLIKRLCIDEVFRGLRVDHVDGLYNPGEYLLRLRKLVGSATYIVVEKILEHGEALPSSWPVAGTTGYDFLAVLNNLFTNPRSRKPLTKYYKGITGKNSTVTEEAHSKKAMILLEHMGGDLENLHRIGQKLAGPEAGTVAGEPLKEAIAHFLVRCPVYRYYGGIPASPDEARQIEKILTPESAAGTPEGTVLLRHLLLERPLEGNEQYNELASHFYRRCMQVAGPLMAKGIEDTLMYTWNCFIGHNEVGDMPNSWGCTIPEFHEVMRERQQRWPLALNGTATHDTKRGEDARARLNALTDVPDAWIEHTSRWSAAPGRPADVHPNDEYLVYQALLASWPSARDMNDFKERITQYIKKALREGKLRSDWVSPDEQYENKVIELAERVMDDDDTRKSMEQTLALISDNAILISLCQLMLKMTCPGIPDIYQGCEMWDYSLVDPDNRRPVDYGQRMSIVNSITCPHDTHWRRLWEDRTSGNIKLALTRALLIARSETSPLFSDGEYLPLTVTGKYGRHILAFARRYGHTVCVIVLPLHALQLACEQGTGINGIDWKDTKVHLPKTMEKWQDILTGENITVTGNCNARDLFRVLPFAIIQSQRKANKRSAGILLPIFSLHSPYGIGDFGQGARNFIDFLRDTHQEYWQLLPLNPTVAGEAHSPYSSISAMAVNVLFISPDGLQNDGLLPAGDVEEWKLPLADKIDYERVRQVKETILRKAWEQYNSGEFAQMRLEFEEFCAEHAHWLDDFALYVCIKRAHEFKPWYNWPVHYRNRQRRALEAFAAENAHELTRVKWLQYIACKQWGETRKYASLNGVRLFGDMPFYISYDSVDVWSHPEIFCLDKDGKMTGVAGVPPDYFSKTGQLWHMPTYNWHTLEKDNYKWWTDRLKRNLQLFDVVRIDHFRAFEAYWQVEPDQPTAEHGKWKKGPGAHFFDIVRGQLGGLPFIAEDLGEEMDDVYRLRDEVGLPGMKVLQFAWGGKMPLSVDTPHNYPENCVVYTGTHDNNTTRGWWEEETSKDDRRRIQDYTGQRINKNNVHLALLRIAYSSIARMAIVTFQDLLGLDSKYRINTPGTREGNWMFRLPEDALNKRTRHLLKHMTTIYNRH